ncbi:uncharacterized protein PGTG_19260 [Puccinia graminis f. sp. tritici CRL 75-36-700-3]|uniref:Uncharacterized protein n=2 Tax=Puccinia graminis f. sp. tritici TaxID=56615 RepID=E3LA64_PUCGT|nr:uncharacterized protein PGTG_19260 [Puccinia graminis f. sp. tritici CRL 75-36-700-3]EFP93457.2 hypothetical protein PGTG_19260 [Puccinia graminis f. sp. tritici CRL 75-36-700-3]
MHRDIEVERQSWGQSKSCDLRKTNEGGGINFPLSGLTVGKGPSPNHVYVINQVNHPIDYLLQNGGDGRYLRETAHPSETHEVPIREPPIVIAWSRVRRQQ